MKKIIIGLMLVLSMSANAGVALSLSAIGGLANGAILGPAIKGGVGAVSIMGGIQRLQNGQLGWGVFFLTLAEKEIISAKDYELLNNADVATQEAFISIVSSEDLSEDEKVKLLSELQF